MTIIVSGLINCINFGLLIMVMKQIIEIISQNVLIVNIIKVLLVFTLCSVLNYTINRFTAFLYKKSKNTKYAIDDVFVATIRKPAILLLWCYCIVYCFKMIETKIDFKIYNFVYKMKSVIFIYCISLFTVSFINKYIRKLISKKESSKEKVDYGLVEFSRKMLLVVSLTLIVIGGLEYMGVNTKGIIALGGIGGIAVGFASKDLLSNLLGGFSIFFDKPFTVGDWISSPDKEIEGTVEKIGWRETKIMSFSNYPIYLPNFIFSEIIIENRGRMKSRLIKENFPVKFSDFNKIEKATADIRDMLAKNPYIDDTSMKVANFDTVGNNTLEIFFYAFSNVTSYENYMKVKESVLLKVIEILCNNGIELEKRFILNTK